MSSESENKRINLTQLEELQLANMDPFKPRLGRQVVTDLISELKRCYEKIDALQGKIDSAHDAMEKYSNEEIDNVCDAYEAVCMAL